MQIICLFFPTFISLKKVVDKKDRVIDIIIKYGVYNVFINLITIYIFKVLKGANYVINSNVFTESFSVAYLLISTIVAFIIPRIALYMKKNIKIEIERETK